MSKPLGNNHQCAEIKMYNYVVVEETLKGLFP